MTERKLSLSSDDSEATVVFRRSLQPSEQERSAEQAEYDAWRAAGEADEDYEGESVVAVNLPWREPSSD